MMVNDLYGKHIRRLVLNARDLPRHLAFDLALETGSSVGNATSLALLRHYLAFTSIRRAGQRTSDVVYTSVVYQCQAWPAPPAICGTHATSTTSGLLPIWATRLAHFPHTLCPSRERRQAARNSCSLVGKYVGKFLFVRVGLVGPVSVYCDWVRQIVCSASSKCGSSYDRLSRSAREMH